MPPASGAAASASELAGSSGMGSVGKLLRRSSHALIEMVAGRGGKPEEPSPDDKFDNIGSRLVRRLSESFTQLISGGDKLPFDDPLANKCDELATGGGLNDDEPPVPGQGGTGESPDAQLTKAELKAKRKQYREKAWHDSVARCELFDGKTSAELDYISTTTQVHKFKAGEVVYTEGDPILPGALFYLVHSGTYNALIKSPGGGDWVAREYGPLDNFGACELLTAHATGRVCTIRAVTPGVLWGVPKTIVESKLRIVSPKVYERNASLVDFCLEHVNLFRGVSRDRLGQLMRGAATLQLRRDEAVCNEGDGARELYLIREGSVVATKQGTDLNLSMYAPDTFGEAALFGDNSLRVRGTRVSAGKFGATIVKWNVMAIETLIGFELHANSERLYNRKMLESIKVGERAFTFGLSAAGIDTLLDSMRLVRYGVGTMVLNEGRNDEGLFLIRRGRATAKRPQSAKTTMGERAMVPLATLERGDLFGEQSLLVLSPDKNAKPVKRKTAIFVEGGEDLVCLTVTPQTLESVGLGQWAHELCADITNNGLLSVDASVVDRATEAGIDVNAAIVTNSPKKRNKGTMSSMGNSVTAVVRDASRRLSLSKDPADKKKLAVAASDADEVVA